MANIKTLINQLRTAIYGLDVRECIAAAIEQTYVDAIDAGNSSMEVAEARGSYKDLNERLNSMSSSSSNTDKTKLTLQEIDAEDVVVKIEDNTFYECLKYIKSLEVYSGVNNIPKVIDVNFRTCMVFQTSEDITDKKAVQNNVVFMGDNCVSGELTLTKNTLYFIEFGYLKANWVIGRVSCYSEGDNAPDEPEDNTIKDFAAAQELINVAMTYFNAREKYITYGQTNILSNNGQYDWDKVTVTGADSPDKRYRNLDCSAFVGLVLRGIQFSEVLLNESTYNKKDLSARKTLYDWATELPRTAADMLKKCEELGWCISSSNWHVSGTDWGGLKAGDLYFLGGASNGRYKGVYHVGIYIGEYINSSGEKKICILDCSSNNAISKHSDGKIKAVRILSFDKVDRSAIVGVARIQVAV